MGIDDLVNKGKGLYEQNKDKIDEGRRSEKAEGISDKLLDAGANFIKKLTPDEHDAKIDDARAKLDRSIGNE